MQPVCQQQLIDLKKNLDTTAWMGDKSQKTIETMTADDFQMRIDSLVELAVSLQEIADYLRKHNVSLEVRSMKSFDLGLNNVKRGFLAANEALADHRISNPRDRILESDREIAEFVRKRRSATKKKSTRKKGQQ